MKKILRSYPVLMILILAMTVQAYELDWSPPYPVSPGNSGAFSMNC